MAARTSHTHVYRPISVSLDPHRPMALFTCVKGTCIDIETLCVLCIEDGNRRQHKRKHAPIKDRDLFNRAVLALTKLVVEIEKHYGPIQKAPERQMSTVPLTVQQQAERELMGVSLKTEPDPDLGDLLVELNEIESTR